MLRARTLKIFLQQTLPIGGRRRLLSSFRTRPCGVEALERLVTAPAVNIVGCSPTLPDPLRPRPAIPVQVRDARGYGLAVRVEKYPGLVRTVVLLALPYIYEPPKFRVLQLLYWYGTAE